MTIFIFGLSTPLIKLSKNHANMLGVSEGGSTDMYTCWPGHIAVRTPQGNAVVFGHPPLQDCTTIAPDGTAALGLGFSHSTSTWPDPLPSLCGAHRSEKFQKGFIWSNWLYIYTIYTSCINKSTLSKCLSVISRKFPAEGFCRKSLHWFNNETVLFHKAVNCNFKPP